MVRCGSGAGLDASNVRSEPESRRWAVLAMEENANSTLIRLDADKRRRIDALARPGLAEGVTLL